MGKHYHANNFWIRHKESGLLWRKPGHGLTNVHSAAWRFNKDWARNIQESAPELLELVEAS